MAFQAHNIPWTVLAKNLKLTPRAACADDAPNLHLRNTPNQAKELNYFVTAFTRTIAAHADSERRKYPETYEAPKPGELIIDDDVATRIAPTMGRWRQEKLPDFGTVIYTAGKELCEVDYKAGKELCPHSKGNKTDIFGCRCALPLKERKTEAFLRKVQWSGCYRFFKVNIKAFMNIEVIKTLLLYGEMGTILKICALPDVGIASWWEGMQCQCIGRPDVGWECLITYALDAFILINLVRSSFPEAWTPDSSRTIDYRHLRVYQKMVRSVTLTGWTSELSTLPHRHFFGIARGQFKTHRQPRQPMAAKRCNKWEIVYPYGRRPYDEFLEGEISVGFLPTVSDTMHVRWMLCQKGLPAEVAQLVLEEASYTPQRRLPVAHDPFHPDNNEELDKYLKYCWQLFIRCEVMARAVIFEIRWAEVIAVSLCRLFECSCKEFMVWDDRDTPAGWTTFFL